MDHTDMLKKEAPSKAMTAKGVSVITTSDPVARQLPLLLQQLSHHADAMGGCVEVIVVDDLKWWPSEEAVSLENYPGLKIKAIWYPEHRGQLQAMLSGLYQASTDTLLTIDPDMYACVAEIPAMQAILAEKNYSVVHGVRSARKDASLVRRFGSWLSNTLVHRLCDISVTDIGSPIAIMRRDDIQVLTQTSSFIGNPRLYTYSQLGDAVASYKLQAGSQADTPSQYSFLQLVQTFIVLINDCLALRRWTARNKSISAKQGPHS